jgi:hypothetical protein
VVAVLGVFVLSGGWPTVQPTPGALPRIAAPAPTDRLMSEGQPAFWAGLNYPWKTGQDFGSGGWGHSGVSDSTTYREIDADFANMAAEGVRVVKWRVFSDGRYGLQFGDKRQVSGLDEFFLPDLDAALEIAKRHDLYLVLTLFSSGFWTADCQSGPVHLGGQADTLTDPTKRQALIDRAVVPLLDRVGASDRVVAFEIIAEPEWGITELNQEQDARIKLAGQRVCARLRGRVRLELLGRRRHQPLARSRPGLQRVGGRPLERRQYGWRSPSRARPNPGAAVPVQLSGSCAAAGRKRCSGRDEDQCPLG